MGHHSRRGLIILTFLGLVSIVLPASADRIVLIDGNVFDGDVKSEDAQKVTLEISSADSALVLTKQISKSNIKSWQRVSHEGAPYVVLPLRGAIGEDVTADALRAGLDQARAANPKIVILAIDSPGGSIGEMWQMTDLLIDASRDMQIIAYVKSAYSAAAVVAMCCKQVYMKPEGVIGAAVPFKMTENGPADVDAKFRSAIQAKIRATTAQGEHADLLIRGMSEADLEIYLTQENNQPVLKTEGPGKLIKAKGQILTLTADEAVECGLAKISPNMSDLGSQVAGGAWYEVSHRPFNTVLGTAASQKQRVQELSAKLERQRARLEALKLIKPECTMIDHRIATLYAKAVADKDAIDNQTAQLKSATSTSARQNLQINISNLKADGEAAIIEAFQLAERKKALLATLPPE